MRGLNKKVLLLGAAVSLVSPMSVLGEQDVTVDAYGNDPDWQLHIMEKGNRINFTLEGESMGYRHTSLGPTLHRDARTFVYRVLDDHHAMSVFVKGKACRDSKTGKSHDVTVFISFDGKGYGGCGDVLTHLLEP